MCQLEVRIEVPFHNKGLTTGSALEVLLDTVHRFGVLLQGILAFERYAADFAGEQPTVAMLDHVSLERALAGTYLVTLYALKHLHIDVHCLVKLNMHLQT